eukprot:gene3682-6496_t
MFKLSKKLFNAGTFNKYHQKTNFFLIRKALERYERFSIPKVEFFDVCQQHGVSEEEATKLSDLFNASGIFIQEKDNIIIKPHIIYKKLVQTIEAENPQIVELKNEIKEIEEKLEVLDVTKEVLDTKARRTVTGIAWTGTLYLTTQMGVLMHMTWTDYGWDVVEPISFFVGFSVVYIGVIYSCLVGSDYEYVDAYQRFLKKRQLATYKKNDFDFETYSQLQKRLRY